MRIPPRADPTTAIGRSSADDEAWHTTRPSGRFWSNSVGTLRNCCRPNGRGANAGSYWTNPCQSSHKPARMACSGVWGRHHPCLRVRWCSPTAREALLAAKAFIDALVLLEQASRIFQGHVGEAVQTTKTQLNGRVAGGRPDLPAIAIQWEEKWNVVIAETARLEKQFNDVKSKSDGYWNVLVKVTQAIGDSKLREAEVKHNREAQQKWEAAYEAAAANIGRAKLLRDKGNDMKQMMLAAALRRQIAEYTTTLNSIAREAEGLLRSLETLTEQGRSIVTVTPAARS